MDLEFMILDTFDNIRSGLIRFQSLEEADELCKKIEERELKGAEITDLLSRYQKDGGGYDDKTFYQEDAYGAYYKEEEEAYYQEEGYYDEQEEEEEQHEQTEAIDLVKEEKQLIINEYEQREIQTFESEFNSLIQESTNVKKDMTNIPRIISANQKREIFVPFALIKNKQ